MASVMFLGAGASVDAGYPPTANLLNEMEKDFAQSPIANDRDDWERFNKVRGNATGVLAEILNSSNPELVLTLPDLIHAVRQQADDCVTHEAIHASLLDKPSTLKKILKWWDSNSRDSLVELEQIRPPFQRVAQSFFLHKHAQDAQNRHEREYLQSLLSELKEGDTVITTNWDTLAERTLVENQKWSPSDGYGFPVTLNAIGQGYSNVNLNNLRTPSAVRVLKLHGGAGWFRRQEHDGSTRDLYLCRARYLQYLRPPGVQCDFRDEKEPPPGHGPNMNPVIIFPSHLKQLDDPILQMIWGQAAEALSQAANVTIVGYSLPSADVAVHVLLNPLRERLLQNKVQITVVNPEKNALKRLVNFLGTKVETVQETAKNYTLNSVAEETGCT